MNNDILENKTKEELINEINKLNKYLNQKDLAIDMLKLNIKILSKEK